MKKLSKINLHNLSQVELSKREESLLKGGCECTCRCGTNCGCLYAGEKENDQDSYYGGSSTNDNGYANAEALGANPANNATSNSGW